MDLHNTVEDIVISRVDEIFRTLEEEGNKKFCTCTQCRLDVICYALNRLPPHYIISHRGASRASRDSSIKQQQQTADVVAMIHDGLKQVTHNQRPNCSAEQVDSKLRPNRISPVFNIPTIMGRLFSGSNFSPITGVDVELLQNGKLVSMKDGNWQNPYRPVDSSEGTFSFWPAIEEATKIDDQKIFSYTVRVSSSEFETLTHAFKIPMASELREVTSFSLERTFKLPDFYLFPPGGTEDEDNLI